MPKKSRKKKLIPVEEYDSDDERRYVREKVPDPTQDDYYYDEVDQFHSQKNKVLLESGIQEEDGASSLSEDEVLGLGINDDEFMSDDDIQNYRKQLRRFRLHKKKDEMGSDIDEDEERGLPDLKAWGKRRSKYYGADISDDDIDLSGSENEESAAILEEKEALILQKKMAAELDDMDFGLEIFKKKNKAKDQEPSESKIQKDLSQLSKKEKLKLLQKESPEMLPLIEDFKVMMKETNDVILPLSKLVKEGKIQGKEAEYVQCKLQLNLNYCTNISFYMMLKAKHIPVQNHPVIKRIVQYRNLKKQLEPVDLKLSDEIKEILTRLQNGEDVTLCEKTSSQPATFVRRKALKSSRKKTEQRKLSEMMDSSDEEDVPQKKQKKEDKRFETEDEKAALQYYEMMKKGRRTEDGDSKDDEEEQNNDDLDNVEDNVDNDEEEMNEDGKRAITYQIEKNKGLTAHKKKELRNPRVKHRMKFRKAKIRRKGQVPEARTEVHRYGGEMSGIKAGIKRGIKMKV